MINKRDLRRLEGVDTRLALIFYEVQRTCPYEIHVAYMGGRRTAEEQNSLYLNNKSKKDGFSRKSKHQHGMAVDFVIYEGSKAIWNTDKYWQVVQHFLDVAENIFDTRIRSGADWDMDGIRVDKDRDESFLDSGHIELI